MAKALRGKKNKKNWKKGLSTKEISLGTINTSKNRKGIILT